TSAPGAPLENALLFCSVRSRLTGNRFVSLPFSDSCEPLFSDPQDLCEVLDNALDRVGRDRRKYFELRPLLLGPALCGTFEPAVFITRTLWTFVTLKICCSNLFTNPFKERLSARNENPSAMRLAPQSPF